MKNSNYSIPETIEEEFEKVKEYDVKKMHQYIWKNYKRDISGKLEIIILFSLWCLLLPELGVISFDFLRNNPLFDELFFFIAFTGWGIFFAISITVESRKFRIRNFKFDEFKKKFQPYEFNLNFIFFLIIATLGGWAVLMTIGVFVFPNPTTPLTLCGSYLQFLLPVASLYWFFPRTYGAGRTRMVGLYLLLMVDNPEKYKSGVLIFINELIRGWDDWIAEVLHSRIKNYEQIQTQLYNKIISNPTQFRNDMKDKLDQNFFDALKDWDDINNVSKVSKSISSLLDEPVEYIPETLLLRIKRKKMITTLISMIFMAIFYLIALISTIYSFFPD